MPRDIGAVYGIPRSGMIPASIIATAIGARLGVLGGATFIGARHRNFAFEGGNKILVVDDSIHHGRAIKEARTQLESLGGNYYTCAIYAHPRSVHLIDFFAEVLDHPRLFEWNFSGIASAGKFCWSMDGVICAWTAEQRGRRAAAPEEIRSARPLYLPQIRVRSIVVERGERWRGCTEAWLASFGVAYDELIMLPDSRALRRSPLSLAEFKARCVTDTGCELLVEGLDRVAKKVASLTGRHVLSVEGMKLF